MDIQGQESRALDKVAELVGEIKFAMLTTQGDQGELHSRPMTTLQIDSDGCLWFFTAAHSHIMDEVDGHARVNLAYARIDKQDYLSVTGTAQIVRDRGKMQELWTPWLTPWFPEGLDDPELVLLKVRMEEADYWAAPGSAVKRLYGLVKGILTRNPNALGEHGSVRNPH